MNIEEYSQADQAADAATLLRLSHCKFHLRASRHRVFLSTIFTRFMAA